MKWFSKAVPFNLIRLRGDFMKPVSLAVLASGRGSNLQSIIDAVEAGELDAQIEVVISNNPDAQALQRAEKADIKTAVVDHRNYESREEYDRQVMKVLDREGVELVALAGFMRVLSEEFVQTYRGRIMNIHPALLPAFKGLDAQKQALDYGVKVSGCTVHFVDEGVDTGPIILQKAVVVKEDDDEESLAARILEWEHKIYPQAIQLYAEDRLQIEGRRVHISGGRDDIGF